MTRKEEMKCRVNEAMFLDTRQEMAEKRGESYKVNGMDVQMGDTDDTGVDVLGLIKRDT